MKTLRHRCFLFLFIWISVVLNGCNSQSVRSSDQSILPSSTNSAAMTLSPTNTKEITKTEIPTNTATPIKSMELNDSQKILLNVTTTYADLDICYPQGSTEVWQSSFPFTEKQVLLPSDPNSNYFAPTYSPDGQWIAYIESKPVIENLDLENPSMPNPIGNDSIWIMHSDGSEKQRISTFFDSYSLYDFHFCHPYSRLDPFLSWSPDGKYIYFVDFLGTPDSNRLDYYILNIQTKELYLLNSSKWNTLYGFAWLSESGRFLYGGDNEYWTNEITSKGIDQNAAQRLAFNSSITNSYIDSGSGLIDPILISQNDSLTTTALWQYDSTQNSWSKVIEYTGSLPRLGNYWGVFSDGNDNFYFIDLRDMRIIGPITYKEKIGDFVFTFPEVTNSTGYMVVSIMDAETNNIWGINPNLSQELFLLLDWDSLDPEHKYSIIDQYPSWDWSL